jgi:hypothetical protein
VSLILILLAARAFPGVCRWLYNGISPRIVIVSIAALPALLTVFCFDPLLVAGNLTRSAVIVRLIQGIGYFGAVVLVGILNWGLIGAVLAFAIGPWLCLLRRVQGTRPLLVRSAARGVGVECHRIASSSRLDLATQAPPARRAPCFSTCLVVGTIIFRFQCPFIG